MPSKAFNVKIIDYIIYILLLFYLVVDTLTGFTIRNYSISFSIPYKILLLFLMMFSAGTKNQDFIIIFSFLLFLLSLSLLSYFNIPGINFSESASYFTKLIGIPIYYIYFFLQIKYDKKNESKFKMVMSAAVLVFLINIVAGIFGFGYTTYSSLKVGIKGFFNAGNEVSILFLCLYYYILSKTPEESKRIYVIYIASFVISVLIATKTGVMVCLLLSFIDFYYRTTKIRRLIFLLSLPAIVLILYICVTLFLFNTAFYEYFNWAVLSKISESKENILDVLLSGRIGFLEENYAIWKRELSLMHFLFGVGNYLHIVEIDFFDALFYCGFLLSFFLVIFYMSIIIRCIKKNNARLFFFNVLFLAVSFTAGHAWISVMAGLYFAYINANELGGNYAKIRCRQN